MGAAYIRGIAYAVKRLKADAVMEMDADFSHKPEDVPRLISTLDQGADFVIGSRYIGGGTIPQDWSFIRKMNSKWGNIFARFMAGLYSIHDCTAGFRAIRVSVIKNIDLENIKVKGYAFQISLLHQAYLRKAIIREIPVDFIDRKRGVTKLGLSDIIEFLVNICRIRISK